MIEIILVNKLKTQLDGKEFDLVITSGRGGLMMAQLLAYGLNIRTVHVVTDVRTVFPSIQPTQRVLVVDDINDTGATMAMMLNKLTGLGVKEITTAVLYERHNVTFKADHVGMYLLHDEWHKFSWDV